MTTRSLALGNDPVAEEAANDYLLAGGSALGAVLAGYFAAAGGYAGVLLGPSTILVGGIGVGARAFDGRLRQPGLGTKRPRGFTDEAPIPAAARVAVPASVAAAFIAHAYDGTQKLGSIVRAGIQRAQRANAPERADLIGRVRAAGAGALNEPSFVRAVLRVAGPSEGGLLTPADFGALSNLDQPAVERTVADRVIVEVPWAHEELELAEGSDLGIGCAVIAVDVRGQLAALAYRRLTDGFAIEELELEAPLAASPVLRGVTRVSPGAPLPAPAPLALRGDSEGNLLEVIAAPGAQRLDEHLLGKPPLWLRRDPGGRGVEAVR